MTRKSAWLLARVFLPTLFVCAALAVPQDSSPTHNRFGTYGDPNHKTGFRIVSTEKNSLSIVGKDAPGSDLWCVNGTVEGTRVVVDFSPKGGPKNLHGEFTMFAIKWEDGNEWPRQLLAGSYSDPNHKEGYRYISQEGEVVKVVGRDSPDGESWKISGKCDDREVVVDFSPKGGPKNLHGEFNGLNIKWEDGNEWKKEELGGLFSDPNHPQGFRVVTTTGWNELAIFGKDTASGDLWKVKGRIVDNVVTADFSPKGGPAKLLGTFDGGSIHWQDGNSWKDMDVATY